MVIGRVFVIFSVVENVVTINSPASSNPLVNFFIKNSFLWELVLNIMLGRLLECCVFTVYNIVHVVVVMRIVVTCSKSPNRNANHVSTGLSLPCLKS